MPEIPSVTLERLALGSRTDKPLMEGQVAYLQQYPSRYVALEPHPTFERMQIAFTTDVVSEIEAWMQTHPDLRPYHII